MNKIESCYKKVAEMPPLEHKLDGEEIYDPAKSAVLKWLADQVEVREWAFEQLRNAGAVVYDPDAKRWKGGVGVISAQAVLNAEQLFDELLAGPLPFAMWQHRVEARHGVKVGKWSFVRAMQPLLDDGRVHKEGRLYRAAVK